MALAPAFGDHIDDSAAAALLPVVVAQAQSIGAGGAAPNDGGVQRSAGHQVHRCAELAGERFAHQPAVGDGQRRRSDRSRREGCVDGATEQQIVLAAVGPRIGAAGVPAERRGQRLHRPGPGAMGEAFVEAEHAIEKARRVRAHQLPAQAVARRCRTGLHGRALGRQPACTDLGVGQEGRGHDRLDRRSRHRVVEHGRVQQRIGAVLHPVRQARVALRIAPRPVDVLARARRQRPGQRLDAPAGDIDDRHRRHPHHRAFEQCLPDRPLLVLVAPQAERATVVVAAGIAGRRSLGQRLQHRVDRQIDREAHLDRGAVERDAAGRVADAGRRAGLGGIAVGDPVVRRARRLAQRLERTQHRVQRRRHHPARVADRIGQARFSGQRRRCVHRRRSSARDPGHHGVAAQALLHAARAGDNMGRRGKTSIAIAATFVAAEIDATGDAVPGIAARHVVRRDLHPLIRAPARQRRAALGAAPGQGFEHAGVGGRERGQRRGEIAAADLELLTRVLGRFDHRAETCRGRGEPTCGVKADALADAWVGTRAKAQQRGVERRQLRRDLLSLRWPRCVRAADELQPFTGTPGRLPFALTLRQAGQQIGWRGRCGRWRGACHDGPFEGLQRRNMAHADVAVGAAAPGPGARLGRAIERHQQDDGQHDRHHGHAGRDRELEQRAGAPFKHRRLLRSRLRAG